MTRYSKFNVIYLLQKWMDSVPGQTFLNYAYSWGASVVILGTLFKLTHIPGANLMLFIGMGTEVFVFFLSAFDRPFDKTTDGMDLQTHYGETPAVARGEGGQLAGDEIPEGEGSVAGAPVIGGSVIGGPVIGGFVGEGSGEGAEMQPGHVAAAYGGAAGGVSGGTIIIGGGPGISGQPGIPGSPDQSDVSDKSDMSDVSGQGGVSGQGVASGQGGVAGISTAWLGQQQRVSPEMAEATEKYVEELKNLTEMLGKVNEQSIRLTRDSEEMENLNRTLTGICKVYEMQLKSASQQIGTIDQINEQTKHMAQQIEQLNQIYARMIEAMTVNMRGAAPAQPAATQPINLHP